MINYFNRNEHIDTDRITYVKEHIIIRSGNDYRILGNKVLEELTALKDMGPDYVIHSHLVLKFGNEPPITFKDGLARGIDALMKLMADEKPLEIQADYLIDNNFDFPNDTVKFVARHNANPESYFCGFYTTLPSTEEDPEMMLAYGTLNHKTYNGLLPAADRSASDDHVWSCAWPGVICEAEDVDTSMQNQLKALADSLSRFSAANQMECEDDRFYFQMNATELHGKHEIIEFLTQAQKMQDLTDQISRASCCYMVAFTDIMGINPVSVLVRLSPDGSYQMKYTEI